ncbi:S1C family serine protease [Paenibacillus sp. MBLB4367]|uniref:S1C family serine protease n=1 Tax=Paenibacillus sp. MBLB4367 TaxID=3384767 RepID=UPI003908067F
MKLSWLSLKWFSVMALLLGIFVLPFGNSAYAAAAGDDVIPQVVEQASPSVVAIIGRPTDDVRDSSTNRFRLAHGTGVIVRADGLIMTNAHVVKDMGSMVVVTSTGKTYNGKMTHIDEESDLALVKIEASGLPAATFAAASDIRAGETVVAVGTPVSFALRNSVTVGIVSGIERSVQSKYKLIQTDAAINPGNSGGALVNLKGQVVGINTMKFVDFGVDNLGFAIPVETVQYVLKHFLEYGKVMRPYLGLELEESWEAVVGLPTEEPLKVAYVDPDSPAAKAGVKQNDVLLKLGSAPLRTLVDYNEALKTYLPGQTVNLTVKSEGKEASFSITLTEDKTVTSSKKKENEGNTAIDTDQGKTKIGDSENGWSMKYPPGLMSDAGFDDEDSATFFDSKGEFMIHVQVEDNQGESLSKAALMRKISGESRDAIVLEKRYIDSASAPYVKTSGKLDENGGYFQARAYQHKGKVYLVSLFVYSGENNVSSIKVNSYIDLLDSFTLSFDTSDTSVKDLRKHKKSVAVTTEYGLAMELPEGWEKDGDSVLSYSDDDKRSFSVSVTSASSGDKLSDWADREEAAFKSNFAQGYREVGEKKERTVSGVPAIEASYGWTMGKDWENIRVLYLIKDKYKYSFAFHYPKQEKAADTEAWIGSIVDTIQIDKELMNESLGFIQDEDELADPDATTLYTNKTYKYSVRVPEEWITYSYGSKTDRPVALYSFAGGSFTISADEDRAYDEVVKKKEAEHKKSAEADADYKYTVSDETLFGESGKAITVQYSTNKVPYETKEFYFAKNGITYSITYRINDAVKTDLNTARLKQAFESIKLLD